MGRWKVRMEGSKNKSKCWKVELGFCFKAKVVGIKRHMETKGAESNLADNVMTCWPKHNSQDLLEVGDWRRRVLFTFLIFKRKKRKSPCYSSFFKKDRAWWGSSHDFHGVGLHHRKMKSPDMLTPTNPPFYEDWLQFHGRKNGMVLPPTPTPAIIPCLPPYALFNFIH